MTNYFLTNFKINIKPIILINTMCPAKYLHTNVSLENGLMNIPNNSIGANIYALV
jgi:hypothetical protein